MRLTHRLSLSLAVVVATVSLAFAYYGMRSETKRLEQNLDRQALVLAESLADSAEPLVANRSYRELDRLVDRFQDRERIAGVAVYNKTGEPLAVTRGLESRVQKNPSVVTHVIEEGWARSEFLSLAHGPLHVAALPLRANGMVAGALAIFHDAAYIQLQTASMWRRALLGVAIETALIVAITLLTLRWGFGRPLHGMAQWLRALREGDVAEAPNLSNKGEFEPLTREVSHLASSLTAARAAAEEEARLRDTAESTWTSERLRVFVKGRLDGRRLFVVSNREPYEHIHGPNGIECRMPASGLVTALEPVLRACDGMWVAQGTGNADAETVDVNDRVRVPPDNPQYALRRVWLGTEEEEGFYLGFSNEGLWPLCHIAHTRPLFRGGDWEHYKNVNRKFADVVLAEIENEESPAILVQDYHFALLPRMIKQARPDARVAIFWHIPWPNPEAFGICPWQRELLDGLLGADLIGFHIQAHCNNFLETVDRVLESRLDRESFTVNRNGHHTTVRPYPISVTLGRNETEKEGIDLPHMERSALLANLGVRATFMGIGVDRIDYTKGIPERFRGIEAFLEKCPAYRREFTFVQIGSPSRTEIKRYHDLMEEVEQEADRINRRFETSDWRPIVLLKWQHSHEEILPYFRKADFCLVTPLHDGMNLVAKEFIAARDDDQGVLILSRFAGAAHELGDALVVNPYDTEELADAIHRSLEMSPEERRIRMQRMRAIVRERNVYRWAGTLIGDLCERQTPKMMPALLRAVAKVS